jgi:murein DD-endopeptidase MepM/ murein hydrolase activator NlpD
MIGLREFVQRLGPGRKLMLLLPTVIAATAGAGVARRIEPHPFARAFAPGEVVRFEVVTDPGVSSLTGTFQAGPLAFVEAAREAAGAKWVGWGVIPLDASPGAASYRLTAARSDGPSQLSIGELTVEAKSFPEQRLTVESKFVNPPGSESKRIEREKKKLAGIYARRTPLPAPAAPFVRPVPGDPTSEFGTHRFFNGEARAPHPGIDLHAATGTPVVVAGPGRVALAADLYFSGGTVIVDHGSGLFTVYAHLSKIEVKEGATVRQGDPVGLSGATGRVTGPHLHWGARVGEAIFDPRALLDPRLFGLPAAEQAPAP